MLAARTIQAVDFGTLSDLDSVVGMSWSGSLGARLQGVTRPVEKITAATIDSSQLESRSFCVVRKYGHGIDKVISEFFAGPESRRYTN